ncbi:hypothetical protein ACVDG8_021670 [Mesorhizobium sp. ORM8.1]
MADQVQGPINTESSEAYAEQSAGHIPFGGTISSIFLMLTLSAGIYFFYVSVTNDFTANWKVAYWGSTIATILVSLIWTISLCGRYGLTGGHMMGGVLLSSLSVICLILLAWIDHSAHGSVGNGEVLVGVLAATFGAAALGMNVIKTNLIFGVFLTLVQLMFSLVLLLLVAYFWSDRAGKRR